MKQRLFTIDTYLGPKDKFHFARKRLAPDPIEFAHFHDYYELFIVEKGEMEHWVNGAVERLTRGSLVFVRPSDVHALRALGPAECEIVNIMFRRDSADHLLERYGDDLAGQFFWLPAVRPATYHLKGPRMERAINTANELRTSIRSLSRIEEFLLSIMTRVVDIPENANGALPSWLIHACAEARRPEVFRGGAAAFVSVAGRAHEHVTRKTSEHLGMTPSRYINKLRMEHAALLLAGSDQPIPDIAESCGIEALSHFYRVFRSHYGVTPKEYRMQRQKSPV